MEVFAPVEYLVGGICLAGPSGAVGHVMLVDIVPAAVAHIAVCGVAPLQSMAGLETVYLVVCLESLSFATAQIFSSHRYAEVV